MDGLIKKELPNDVVENILSRLPVKNLHRLKTVCKSWDALISDPIFAGVHLRRWKSTSFNQDLFYWHEQQCGGYDDYDYLRDYRRISKNQQKKLSTKNFPLERKLDPTVLCYCDGLSLRRYLKLEDKMYVLHNLSCNTYIEFSCPYPIYHHTHTTLYGICYDALINDYKVVIIDSNHYAVFHCRNQHWSEMKEITKHNFSHDEVVMGKGVSLNGDMYWILQTKEEEEENIIRFGMEIVGFDSTREKFKKLPKPNYTREDRLCISLTYWKGYLYLMSNKCEETADQMIKVDDADDDEEVYWTEYDGTLPLSYWARAYSAVASPEDTTVLKVGNDWFTTMGYVRIPYLQNMFFSSSSNSKQVSKRRSSWKPLDIIYKMLFPRSSKQHN